MGNHSIIQKNFFINTAVRSETATALASGDSKNIQEKPKLPNIQQPKNNRALSTSKLPQQSNPEARLEAIRLETLLSIRDLYASTSLTQMGPKILNIHQLITQSEKLIATLESQKKSKHLHWKNQLMLADAYLCHSSFYDQAAQLLENIRKESPKESAVYGEANAKLVQVKLLKASQAYAKLYQKYRSGDTFEKHEALAEIHSPQFIAKKYQQEAWALIEESKIYQQKHPENILKATLDFALYQIIGGKYDAKEIAAGQRSIAKLKKEPALQGTETLKFIETLEEQPDYAAWLKPSSQSMKRRLLEAGKVFYARKDQVQSKGLEAFSANIASILFALDGKSAQLFYYYGEDFQTVIQSGVSRERDELFYQKFQRDAMLISLELAVSCVAIGGSSFRFSNNAAVQRAIRNFAGQRPRLWGWLPKTPQNKGLAQLRHSSISSSKPHANANSSHKGNTQSPTVSQAPSNASSPKSNLAPKKQTVTENERDILLQEGLEGFEADHVIATLNKKYHPNDPARREAIRHFMPTQKKNTIHSYLPRPTLHPKTGATLPDDAVFIPVETSILPSTSKK